MINETRVDSRDNGRRVFWAILVLALLIVIGIAISNPARGRIAKIDTTDQENAAGVAGETQRGRLGSPNAGTSKRDQTGSQSSAR